MSFRQSRQSRRRPETVFEVHECADDVDDENQIRGSSDQRSRILLPVQLPECPESRGSIDANLLTLGFTGAADRNRSDYPMVRRPEGSFQPS